MYKISNMSWCFKYKLTLSLYRRLFSQHPVDHIDRSYTIMSMFTLRALLKNDHESFINIEFKTHNVCARNVQCRYTCNMFDDLPAYSQSVCIYQSPTIYNKLLKLNMKYSPKQKNIFHLIPRRKSTCQGQNRRSNVLSILQLEYYLLWKYI